MADLEADVVATVVIEGDICKFELLEKCKGLDDEEITDDDDDDDDDKGVGGG